MFIDTEFEEAQEELEAEGKIKVEGGEQPVRGKSYAVIPGHLASPLYEGECKMLLKGELKIFSCYRHKMLKRKMIELDVGLLLSDIEDDPLDYLSKWVDDNVHWRGRIKVDDLCDYAANWNLQLQHHLEPSIRGGLLSRGEVVRQTKGTMIKIRKGMRQLSSEFVEMKKVEVLKDSICFKEIEMGFMIQFGSNLHSERDVSFIKHKQGWAIFPTTMLLCALDKKQSIFPLFSYWIVCDALDKYQGLSIFTRGKDLFDKFITLRKIMRQDFFSLVGTWESLMVGWVVNQEDDIGCSKLFNSQSSEFDELLRAYPTELTSADFLPTGSTIENICLHLELTGMNKIFGFPTLEEPHLLDQLREHGVGPKHQLNHTTIENIIGLIRRDFLLNYFKKKGRYPRIKICPEQIKYYVTKNKPIPVTLSNNYTEWGQIVFDKNFNYDFAPDQMELLKDSACAVNLSAWGTKYDRCSFKYLYDKPPPPSSRVEPLYPRRTITAFLKGAEDEVRKAIHNHESGIYPEEDHIAIQNGKECELKIKTGRSFTTQTPTRRLVQTSMEMNISKTIFPFVPEQSMTDSEILCLRRILEQVESMEGESEIVVLDLKKWCLFQRHIPNQKLGQMYDELFGLHGLYQHGHSFFIDCNIFNNSRNHPPNYDQSGKPIPGPFYMNNYDGAFEGLGQKQWTHLSSAAVKYVGEICGIETRVMCQGDNQIIVLTYRETQDKNSLRDHFLRILGLTFNEINHELKDKETWYSKRLHEYGKMRVYKGCFVSQGTKKASRCIPDINDGLFAIPSSIATLNTITESIARADQHPDAAFIMNQMMVGNYLVRKGLCQHNETVKMRSLLLFPVDFGGIPLSSYNAHSLRGHDDKISLWCSIIKTCQLVDPQMFQNLMQLWLTSPDLPAKEAKDRSRLYEDIFSLNIKSLPSITREIKDMTLEFLRSDYVTNPVVTKLYQSDYAQSKEELIASLDKMKLKFVPLAHELLSLSNAGILEMMQKKITSTKTIEQVVQQKMDMSLIDLYTTMNTQYKTELKARFDRRSRTSDYQLFFSTECPTRIAKVLRELSWGPGIIGVTKPIYNHQVTMKMIDDATDEELEKCVTIQVSDQFVNTPLTFSQVFGPYQPYIASMTKEKVKRKSSDIVEKTSHVLSLLDLIKLRSWMTILGHENLVKFIDILISEKLEVVELPQDIDDISDLGSSITSGNIFHRFLTDVESNFAIVNCCTGVTTHFKQSSNTMRSMTAGGKDWTIFYQMIYVANMTQLMAFNRLCQRPDFQYVSIISCDYCSELIEEVDFDLDEVPISLIKPSFTPLQTYVDPIIQIPNIKEVMSIDVGRRFASSIDAEYDNSHVRSCAGVKLSSAHREVISLNDLRQLDLTIVFHTLIMFSNHCAKTLRDSGNPILESISVSRAFIPLAEALFNSGLIHKFIAILGYPATEHTMLTRTDGLSSLISRALPSYCRSKWDQIVTDSMAYYFREDYDSPEMRNIVRRILKLTIKITGTEMPNASRAMRALKMKNVGSALHHMRIHRKLVSIPREQVLLSWRSSDRPEQLDLEVAPPSILLRDNPIGYPMQQVFSYFFERAVDTNLGLLDIPEMSFLSRPLGDISSAASKYTEILEVFQVLDANRGHSGTVYGLAEGSCGSGVTIMKMLPNTKFSYNSLMTPSIDNRYVVTDHTPPGLMNSQLGTSERVKNMKRLAHGVTDIKDERFHKKLKNSFDEYPPFIITMDAESKDKGTNLDFLVSLLPIITEYMPNITVFKMFLQYDFRNFLVDIIPDSMRWCLYKPMSSNPCGPEIFLVLIPLEHMIVPLPIWMNLLENQNNIVSYMCRDLLMTSDVMAKYYEVSLNVERCLRSLYYTEDEFQHHLLFSRYDKAIMEGVVCGLHCKTHMSYLGEAIERIHGSIGDDYAVPSSIRRSGTDEVCARLTRDLVYLMIYMSNNRDMIKTLSRLTTMVVSDDFLGFRAGRNPLILLITPPNGNFIKKWGDMKMYMKDHSRQPYCGCNAPTLEWEIDPERPSLVQKIMDNLMDAALINRRILFFPTW